jgi:hypothetical protein
MTPALYARHQNQRRRFPKIPAMTASAAITNSVIRNRRFRFSKVRPRINILQSPPPAAPPSASPAATAAQEPHGEEQQYCADGCVDNGTDQSGTEMDAQLGQQPTSYECTQNADNEITGDPKTGPSHQLTRQPAGDETDKQNNQQTFTRHIHCATSACASHAAVQADLLQAVPI